MKIKQMKKPTMNLIDTSRCNTPAEAGIERLRALYALMSGIPSDHVNLSRWRTTLRGGATNDRELLKTECGTTGCAVGWATAHPEFKAQGFTLESGVPSLNAYCTSWSAVEIFFNLKPDMARYIFLPLSDRDAQTMSVVYSKLNFLEARKKARYETATLSHKQLVMLRILRYLEGVSAITPERFEELAVLP